MSEKLIFQGEVSRSTKALMLQGTASDSGKSTVVAGLCRYYARMGYKVYPFKSQNMALNSYVTLDGKEMGRAQVFQAEAAMREPEVRMNPILLKPSSDMGSQVIIEGQAIGHMNAKDYYAFKHQLVPKVQEIYQQIANENDLVLIEGAGSPAEINLKEHDIVNMGMAKIADANVLLVADIDKGGVFASIYGTVMLLEPEERARIKGIIINKFRGDKALLQPGIEKIQALINIPVVGVIPYLDLDLDAEDSLALEHKPKVYDETKPIKVAIILLPKISNFTDFHLLELMEDVSVKYVPLGNPIGEADVIILPGTKSTMADCKALMTSGRGEEIKALVQKGSKVIGICGGYQILGKEILDEAGIEGEETYQEGLGLLPISTSFLPEKTLTRVEGYLGEHSITGYEIHMGRTTALEKVQPLLQVTKSNGESTSYEEGVYYQNGDIIGTYLHGILDNQSFVLGYINQIRAHKGLRPLLISGPSLAEHKEQEYNRLADSLGNHCDMKFISELLGIKENGNYSH